jgi:PAS domain S-box-containing protein
MEITDEKNLKRYTVGLCPWSSSDFAEILREEDFDVVELEEFFDEGQFPDFLDAVVIDLSGEESVGLEKRVARELPNTPRILITARTGDIPEDTAAFAIIHRPITAIELIDVLIWACEFKRLVEKNPTRARLIDHPRVDVFLEETATELLPTARWLSAIFEHLPLGLILLNPDGTVMRANRPILEKMGISGIGPGNRFEDIAPWKEIGGGKPLFQQCLAENKVLRDVFETEGGNFVDAIHVPVISDGFTTGVLLILEDVSDETGFTNRLMDISDVIDEGIAIIDRDYHYVWANKKIRDWFGIPEDYRSNVCRFVLGEDKELCDNCQVRLVFQDGQMHSGYFRAKTVNGEKKTFEMIASPIKNRRGEITRAVKILRDVTGRENILDKLAMTKNQLENTNAELSRRLNNLRMLTELSFALQTVENLEKNLQIFLTAATAKQGCGFNRAFLFLVNRNNNTLEARLEISPPNPEEAGRIWNELESQPATFADVLERYGKRDFDELSKDRTIQGMAFKLNDKSSLLVNILFSKIEAVVYDANSTPGALDVAERLMCNSFAIVPLLAMGKPVGVVVVDNQTSGHPIEDSKVQLLKAIASHASLTIERSLLLDELRERNELLQEAYRKLQENQDILIRSERLSTIGKLAAQVAHEIRNPLVSIGGFARNIAKRAEPDSPIRNYSNIIWDETKRLESILEDVLSYSRHSEPKLRDYDINQLLLRTIELLEEQIESNKIELKLSLEEGAGEIPMDPDQIRQVMMNLCKNAIAAMPDGGTLEIETTKAGGFVWVNIKDSGEGIPDEFRDKIFEPFFTTKSSGTGLGLPISYQIIDAHGGMLWFNGDDGKGTTFHVKLPAKG